MKITIVAGARPNFMKIAPITRAVEAARAQGKLISYRLVYTGKQNDTSLDASLFSDLGMKAPDAYLGIESGNSVSLAAGIDRKSTRLNSSHANISYAVFCLK